ncbi:FG-GAP-like repeat-containing protein [Myxococcota bacterium]|nr:FG-GAP-like repeat-containing protein [Myxococcota bacterium]
MGGRRVFLGARMEGWVSGGGAVALLLATGCGAAGWSPEADGLRAGASVEHQAPPDGEAGRPVRAAPGMGAREARDAGPLLTPAAWAVTGGQASAFTGFSVASAGDVNGDGLADVIVGSPFYDDGSSEDGLASVFHGSEAGPSETADWSDTSGSGGAYFGWSVATAGDVNGDGYDDVVVGGPKADYAFTDGGRAYVYHGSSAGLDPSPAWTADGGASYAQFGWSAASAGDVNGDGYDDVVVGSPFRSNGQSSEGLAYLYLGSASGLSTSPAWTAEANQTGANFGYSVASAGDVNGDGYGDVIVGAPYYPYDDQGKVYVYLGSATGLAASPAWTKVGESEYANAGYSVSSAGDVNGDGYDDVVVGSSGFSGGDFEGGRADVYLGSASGLWTTPAWTAGEAQDGAGLGESVASAGDVNGDGYDDVVVGALYFDVGDHDEGRAQVFLGSADGLAGEADWVQEGWQVWAKFGQSVAAAGDVDGDGYGDLIVGSDSYTGAVTYEGGAFLYRGAPAGAECSVAPVSPAEGADLTGGGAFVWSGDCAGYRLEISDDPTFPADNLYVFGGFADVGGDNAMVPSGTIWSSIGRRFTEAGYWRVVGGAGAFTAATEARSFFTTLVPKPPAPDPVEGCLVNLEGPADGSVIDAPPTFLWNTDCTGAYLELSSSPDFRVESTFYFGSSSDGHYGVNATLWNALDNRFVDGGGYWRVTAGAAEGPVQSETWVFSVPAPGGE